MEEKPGLWRDGMKFLGQFSKASSKFFQGKDRGGGLLKPSGEYGLRVWSQRQSAEDSSLHN